MIVHTALQSLCKPYVSTADEFVALLIDDTALSNVFEMAVSRVDTRKLERVLTRLPETYF